MVMVMVMDGRLRADEWDEIADVNHGSLR